MIDSRVGAAGVSGREWGSEVTREDVALDSDDEAGSNSQGVAAAVAAAAEEEEEEEVGVLILANEFDDNVVWWNTPRPFLPRHPAP